MSLLKNMENFCLNIYSVKKAISNMNLSVLQELWILLGGCQTLNNQWRLLTGAEENVISESEEKECDAMDKNIWTPNKALTG